MWIYNMQFHLEATLINKVDPEGVGKGKSKAIAEGFSPRQRLTVICSMRHT